MSNKNQSIESPVKKLQITKLGRISRIILELEPLADIYERHGTVTFKVCSELLAEFRALERGLLENPQRELKLSDISTGEPSQAPSWVIAKHYSRWALMKICDRG